jgi:hypothetical protein
LNFVNASDHQDSVVIARTNVRSRSWSCENSGVKDGWAGSANGVRTSDALASAMRGDFGCA